MTKSIADLYNEVQNIANSNRRLDVNSQWAHAATPGNIPFDETNNEYMKNVSEAQSKMQQNKAEYMTNNYKKDVPVAAPVPGPAPIPTMKEPKMVTTPNDKKPASIREALAQVQKNVQEGAATDAAGATIGAALRGDWDRAKKSASDWGSAVSSGYGRIKNAAADYLDPAGAVKTTKNPAGPEAPKSETPPPSMAAAPTPVSLRTNTPSTDNVKSQDRKTPAPTTTAAVKPAPKTTTSGSGNYQIRKGDTLSSISRKTGLSIQQIAKQNNIKDVNKIAAGKSLNLSGSRTSSGTAGAVAQDTKPKVTTAPLPPRRPAPKVNTTPSGGTGAAGGNRTPVGGSIIDRQNRNTTPNQSRPAPAPAPVPKIERQQRNTAPSQNRGVVAPPVGGSVSPQTSTSSTAMSRPQDSRSQEKFMKKELNNSYENPLIAAFMKLQETKHSNMFEAAKKKKKPDDKDAIGADVDSNNEGGVPMAENTQLPGHRRLSMFDPSQGYARTAGSADGAKERLEALWGAVTGEQTVQRDPDMAAAIRADLQAMKEEFGDTYDDAISEILEALELAEAPTKKEHELARLAAAAISRGHKVTKLPAGKAEGWADNNVKSSMGGGVAKINSQSGTKTKVRFREEVEVEEEQIDELKKPTPETAAKVVDRADNRDEWSPKAANRLYSAYKKRYEKPETKKEEVEVEEETLDEGKANGHKMTDMDKHLKGYYNVFGRHPIQKNDKLASKVWNKPAADMRMTKSGKIHGQDQKAKANEIKGRLGYHTKAKLPEGVEFSEEELNHIQSVLEGNPINSASVEGPSSSAQAAKGTQVDKTTLTDSKKKF